MRRTLTAAAAAILFTLISSPVRAKQGAGDYLELVRAYTAGDGNNAVARLARWTEDASRTRCEPWLRPVRLTR